VFARTRLAGDGAAAGRRRPGHRAKGGSTPDRIALTIPEVRRLVLAMREQDEQRAFRWGWSRWRRTHQAVAARCQATRRAHLEGSVRPAGVPLGPAVLLSANGKREISDAEWERLRPLLPAQKPLTGRPRHDHRSILSGIMAVVCTGASWREMPAEYGKWETAYKRYRLWCAEGRGPRLLEVLDPGSAADQHAATSGP
jgi:hypothetical protein